MPFDQRVVFVTVTLQLNSPGFLIQMTGTYLTLNGVIDRQDKASRVKWSVNNFFFGRSRRIFKTVSGIFLNKRADRRKRLLKYFARLNIHHAHFLTYRHQEILRLKKYFKNKGVDRIEKK